MSTNNRNNARFLQKQRPKLKKRLIDHLTLRENEIKKILQQTIIHINELGYTSTIIIPNYDESFVNMNEVNKLIDNWRGLHITRVISEGVFHSKSVNWLDQNSKKVSGPYFFALHLKKIKSYLLNYCQHINVSENKRKHVVNYSCIYFVVELLSAEINGFTRCKPQHLMRNTTLTKSKDVHNAFQYLYNLNLVKFVKIVKKNNKIIKKGKQNRIDCKKFAQNFGIYCRNLLNQEKVKLASNENMHNNVSIPTYFRDLEDEENSYEMEIDENKDNPVSSQTIPSQPLSTQQLMQDSDDAYAYAYEYDNCVCVCNESPMIPVPPPIGVGFTTSPIPIMNNEFDDENGILISSPNTYYNPSNDINPNYYPQYAAYPDYRYQYQAPYYRHQRDGYYIGATGHFRYNPYILPPIAPYFSNNIIINNRSSHSVTNNGFNVASNYNNYYNDILSSPELPSFDA